MQYLQPHIFAIDVTMSGYIKSPYEAFTGVKPSVQNMNIFGTLCYAYVQEKKKLLECLMRWLRRAFATPLGAWQSNETFFNMAALIVNTWILQVWLVTFFGVMGCCRDIILNSTSTGCMPSEWEMLVYVIK